MNVSIESSPQPGRSLRSDILFALSLLLACYLAWLLRHVLMLLYVSALCAVLLKPLVQLIASLQIRRWRPFRRFGIVVLLVAVVAGLAAFASLALPPAIRDLHDFAQEMPARLPKIMDWLNRLPFADRIDTDALTNRIENGVTEAATYIFLSIGNWASAIADIAMSLILTIYFSLEGADAYRWALSFFPPPGRERLDATLRRAERRMGRWLLGQGSLMLILGVVSTITYLSLHVRYAYALGFLTGLLNIVPVVGAAVSIGLALIVSAIDSWGRVIGVAIFYVVYLNLENSLLIPRIMRSSVGLPGLSILIGLLIGAALGGIVGAAVSVPTTVLIAELVNEYLVNKESYSGSAVNSPS
jgi:predicted PurR-regulated permease PerM